MRGLHGDNFRNLGRCGDLRSSAVRDATDGMSIVFAWSEEEKRSVSVGDVPAGWSSLALLALRLLGRRVH